jgi:hypothetical protein
MINENTNIVSDQDKVLNNYFGSIAANIGTPDTFSYQGP